MTMRSKIFAGMTSMLALALTAIPVAAQEAMRPGGMAEQSLRPYYLVFAAYAVAIVLVAAWAGSIAKRLSDVEARLAE